jgi:hypothetical protein
MTEIGEGPRVEPIQPTREVKPRKKQPDEQEGGSEEGGQDSKKDKIGPAFIREKSPEEKPQGAGYNDKGKKI